MIYWYYLWKRIKIYMLLTDVHSPCNHSEWYWNTQYYLWNFYSSPEFMHTLDRNWEDLVAHWLDGQWSEREMIPQSGSGMYIHMLSTVVKYAHCHSFKLHWMCTKQKTALHKCPLDLFFNNHLHSPTNACPFFPYPVILLSCCFRFPAWIVVSLSHSLLIVATLIV